MTKPNSNGVSGDGWGLSRTGGSKGALGYDVWAMTKTKKPAPRGWGAGLRVVQFCGECNSVKKDHLKQ
jgi:hypothetical protein